jgi:DNA polymerase III subunit beta
MQLKINPTVLSEAIKKVEKVVKPKHATPILQGIYMEATKEELIFVGSDANETFRYLVPVDGENVEVIQPGKTVLSKQITDVLKKLKKEITMILNGQILAITSARSNFDMNTFDPEEYPKLPSYDIDQPTFSLKGTEFHSIAKKTMFAASESETRPILTGVCLDMSADCMNFVSTDSHRLGKVKTTSTSDKELKVVIPAKSLDNLIKTFDLSVDVHVYCESDNQIIFRNGPLVFYCRLLEGNYPDTSRLIPSEFKSEMKINRKVFLEELEIIKGVSLSTDNGKGGVVKLHVNGAATISSYTAQTGKGQSVVEYDSIEGEETEYDISFSAKYLIDALKAIDDDFVYFKYQGNMRPFVVAPCESTVDELQLILPVRTY